MGKTSELDAAVRALKKCGEELLAAAEALTELFSSKPESPPDTPTETVQQTPEKAITLEEVRAVLAEKSRSGHSADVKVLLERHGASRLSDVDPAEYPALLKEAEVIR